MTLLLPRCELALADARSQLRIDALPYQEWPATAPSCPTQFFRLADGFLARFPGIADFLINESGDKVLCTPVHGGDAWQAIYEQQVAPLLMSLAGEQVYHGGAVAIGGSGVAFLGPSGKGKSTLITAFAARGIPFLGDDCLHLADSGDGDGGDIFVQPHSPTIRLWPDSVARVAPSGGDIHRRPGSPKPRLLAGESLPHASHALPLRRVYVLGDDVADTARLSVLPPADMLLAWAANTFVLELKSKVVLQRNLARAARLVALVPGRRLDYPRRYECLEQVVAMVCADLANGTN